MQQTKSHQDRYAGWDAAPAVLRVHTIMISAYCSLMLAAAGTAVDGLREIISASLIAFH